MERILKINEFDVIACDMHPCRNDALPRLGVHILLHSAIDLVMTGFQHVLAFGDEFLVQLLLLPCSS